MNDNLKQYLMTKHKWPEWQIELGQNANFKCEYCGKYLLDTVDNYYEWQVDHIIPRKKDGKEEFRNYALSCKTCNFIKRHHIPNEGFKELSRQEQIDFFKKYINDKRLKKQQELDEIKLKIKNGT